MNRLIFCVALFCLLLTGCASYNISTACGRTTIDIQNTGWFLLEYFPIASGNPDRPNANRCKLFTDTVTLENNMKLLRHAMLEKGTYKACNIVTHTNSEKAFLFLLTRDTCHTSAELCNSYDDRKTCP